MTSFGFTVLFVLLCSSTITNSFQSRIVLSRKQPTTTVLNAVAPTKSGQLLDEIDLISLTSGTTTSSSSMQRIFQASADGWSANAFHKAVNFNPPLPVFAIMKTTSGVVAGCYNAIGWQSRDDYRESTKSFLFRVVKGGNGVVEKANKLPGSVACYDFGDRAIWMSEGLFVPLNEKYAPLKSARSGLGTSWSTLPSNPTGSLFQGDARLTELEVYADISMLRNSKKMYKEASSPSSSSASSSSKSGQGLSSLGAKLERFLFGDDQS